MNLIITFFQNTIKLSYGKFLDIIGILKYFNRNSMNFVKSSFDIIDEENLSNILKGKGVNGKKINETKKKKKDIKEVNDSTLAEYWNSLNKNNQKKISFKQLSLIQSRKFFFKIKNKIISKK